MIIAFEGIDGSGKTSAMSEVSEFLESYSGRPVEAISFPTRDTFPGLVLNDYDGPFETEILEELLFAHDKKATYEEKLKKLDNEGHIVLCDRFVMSGAAYGKYWDDAKNVFNIKPDMYFVLDVPLDVAEQRRRCRLTPSSKFENKRTLENAHAFYTCLSSGPSDEWGYVYRINASVEKSLVVSQIIYFIGEFLGREKCKRSNSQSMN